MRDLTDDEQQLAYRFAAVALPPDAIACDPWEWHGGTSYRRYFLTREWNVAGIWVSAPGNKTTKVESPAGCTSAVKISARRRIGGS